MSSSVMTVLAVLKSFFRGPWTISRAMFTGLAMGMLGAVFQVFLFHAGPAELTYIVYVAPLTFWTTASIAVWLLYQRVDKAQFCSDTRAMLSGVLALALFALGGCGAVWCYWHHICMCGHMAHPPYPAWHYLFDIAWCASLTVAVFRAWQVRSVLSPALATFAAFLIAFRFLLGSAGGMYGAFPL